MEVSIAIADDQSYFLTHFAHALGQRKELRILFTAASGKGLASKMYRMGPPDVVLLDAKMDPWNGIDTTIFIRNNYPQVKIIALTLLDNERYVIEMLRAGANAFLFKNDPFEHIVESIIKVFQGTFQPAPSPFSLYVLENIYKSEVALQDISITQKEREVLKLICRQHSTDEIAEILNISSDTVHDHRKRLMTKTQSRNMIGLSSFAYKSGLSVEFEM